MNYLQYYPTDVVNGEGTRCTPVSYTHLKEVLGSGITVGSLLALILNLVLPEDKVEETKESK